MDPVRRCQTRRCWITWITWTDGVSAGWLTSRFMAWLMPTTRRRPGQGSLNWCRRQPSAARVEWLMRALGHWRECCDSRTVVPPHNGPVPSAGCGNRIEVRGEPGLTGAHGGMAMPIVGWPALTSPLVSDLSLTDPRVGSADDERGECQLGEREVAMPSRPVADLVLVHAGLLLGHAQAVPGGQLRLGHRCQGVN